MVIVILGILAATALPKFIDLSGDARDAAVEGVAGGMASAAAINFGACSIDNHSTGLGRCVEVDQCADLPSLAQVDLSKYDVSTMTAVNVNGSTWSCTVTDSADASYTATFTGISGGN